MTVLVNLFIHRCIFIHRHRHRHRPLCFSCSSLVYLHPPLSSRSPRMGGKRMIFIFLLMWKSIFTPIVALGCISICICLHLSQHLYAVVFSDGCVLKHGVSCSRISGKRHRKHFGPMQLQRLRVHAGQRSSFQVFLFFPKPSATLPAGQPLERALQRRGDAEALLYQGCQGFIIRSLVFPFDANLANNRATLCLADPGRRRS